MQLHFSNDENNKLNVELVMMNDSKYDAIK